ncbi:TetR/AcrR family transcriptional regulator [Cupriavidus sp. AU9028]|uniref:TetR/AcrR family transcriptional regulator n=1 Tax=Cupriavidus sp. AU9028 TaxID=2871157 RepID=UPI001C951FD0|nr:TetR/AcrR family transcriptional regulator [Cupriavidus sp. AU9028]MBY4896165.1 TetR/AcrR family transcriptional regulator [Cupriavidus sp. AU9028]
MARTNRERTDTTRAALIAAARALFVEKGYAATSTPEIVAAAGITRGALYHHFEDKRALFRAVVEEEMRQVAEEIERAAPAADDARAALVAGSEAYLAAMTVTGRTRLMLVDGPAVLGVAEALALDQAWAGRTLREGLAAALDSRLAPPLTIAALATLLSAAFDRAALAIDAGDDPRAIRAAMVDLIESTVTRGERG